MVTIYSWVVRVACPVEAVTSFATVATVHFREDWSGVDVFLALIDQSKLRKSLY
jgi:hypothetical protein